MFRTQIFTKKNKPTAKEKEEIITFLYCHLEQYGDAKKDIEQAVLYALEEIKSFGGFILVGYENAKICGAIVINHTGMQGYIPENILVYIATHREVRGKGIGKKLMQKAIAETDGNIALHVEKENPAKFLYEKLGFTNPYLEMRLKK